MTRGVMTGVWWNVVLLAGSLGALPFDQRRILGLSPWIKPLKFEISVIVFLLTVGLLLKLLSESGRSQGVIRRLGWGFGIAMILENTIIALQSARGVRSHMNIDTAFDAGAFAAMGLVIAFNTVLLAVLLILFWRKQVKCPAVELWGIRLGLILIVAGSLEGVSMIMNGAHTVGAADGGSGLPFLNWSTQYGDLRVAHFFALHALQFLWGTGWVMGRTRLPERIAVPAMCVAAVLYAGFIWTLFEQALAGRPVLRVS